MKRNAYASREDHKPTIAIFCKELRKGGDPFSDDHYWEAYQDLLFALRDKGVEAYIASDNNLYQGFNVFDKVYTLDKRGPIESLTPVENVYVDVVFDRGRFIGRDVLTINPPILTKIAMSKIEMYEYFSDLQPFSIVGKTKKQTIKAVNEIPGDKIVVKEPEGSGGNEVYIGEKEEVLHELPAQYPVLVQEFLDTSSGVPGQVEGTHDVRLGLCGGEVISYYIRSAKPGEFRANIAQGGQAIYFDVKDVPPQLLEIAKRIDSLFAEQPRYYSLDFMHTEKGWKLVELNPYIGLLPASEGSQAQQTLDALADYLAAECRKQAMSLRFKRS